MRKLLIENVRSFAGRQEITLRPLTFLVGDNSSGKTSLMAVAAVLNDQEGFPFRPAFNKSPFSLGSYDTIATFKGGKFGRAKRFSIGFETGVHEAEAPTRVVATYKEREGQATCSRLTVSGPAGSLEIDFEERDDRKVAVRLRSRIGGVELDEKVEYPGLENLGGSAALYSLVFHAVRVGRGNPPQAAGLEMERLFDLAQSVIAGKSIAIAPIRTRPERVYGQIADAFTPGGDHIPFVLDRLLRDLGNRKSKAVLRLLGFFGQTSGLFSEVRVKKLGRKLGDPFQLMVNVGGPFRNLIDVGYGVSQALPIVVELALSEPGDLLLIQQPEVHLHPRAQAALGSIFANFASSQGRNLLVETHSDFVIDRVRQEIAEGRLEASRAGIIFLERKHLETVAHELTFDSLGNVLDAPACYRDFFLQEQLRLLTRQTGVNVSDR